MMWLDFFIMWSMYLKYCYTDKGKLSVFSVDLFICDKGQISFCDHWHKVYPIVTDGERSVLIGCCWPFLMYIMMLVSFVSRCLKKVLGRNIVWLNPFFLLSKWVSVSLFFDLSVYIAAWNSIDCYWTIEWLSNSGNIFIQGIYCIEYTWGKANFIKVVILPTWKVRRPGALNSKQAFFLESFRRLVTSSTL